MLLRPTRSLPETVAAPRLAAVLPLALAVSLSGCTDRSEEPGPRSIQQPLDSSHWVDDRVVDLIDQMTVEEKISQLQHDAPAIERLGIPAYFYWNEALHGIVASRVTSFPSPIALGATWDPKLVHRVATAVSDEARGVRARDGAGLTYWSPVINLLRDPRWGRYDESFTEDPFLMSRYGVAFVRGLQGDDPRYLKTVATPKHFALNSSEYNRHTGSSDADERLLYEYYLPPFAAAVTEGKAFSVMASYNRVNGVPSSANTWLLEDTLRSSWGFEGFVVSDCGAVADIYNGHQWADTAVEASAAALNAGTDLNCGDSYAAALGTALDQGLVAESDLDRALLRVFRARFLTGEFDPDTEVPYASISPDVIESDAHRELALEAARKAIVLLKNDDQLLPLDLEQLSSIAVIGPHGSAAPLGGYSGSPSRRVSASSALMSRLAGTGVTLANATGTTLTGTADPVAIEAAAELARASDVALVFVGTDLTVLREEQDRPDWALPGAQEELVEAVAAANPRTVLVLVTGGPLGVDWADAHVPAILTTFYNGQEQGTAITEVLFGDHNPGGKLSTTWYRLDATLPPPGEYDIRQGFTYLYHQEPPLYPFGHGLSYTEFSYGNVQLSPARIGSAGHTTVTVPVTNTGDRAGDEIVQLYVNALDSSIERPVQQLRGFDRLHLEPGETRTARFQVGPNKLSYWDEAAAAYRVESGRYEIRVGASSSDIRTTEVLTVLAGAGGADVGAGGAGGGGGESAGGVPTDGVAGSSAGAMSQVGAGAGGETPSRGGTVGSAGAPHRTPAAGRAGSSPNEPRVARSGSSDSGCGCQAPGAPPRAGLLAGWLALTLVAMRRPWGRRGNRRGSRSSTRA